jgi:hypothetical protein
MSMIESRPLPEMKFFVLLSGLPPYSPIAQRDVMPLAFAIFSKTTLLPPKSQL